MYESFYHLKEKAFNLNPDPDYFYMSKSHDNAFTNLQYAIVENKGFVVITGEIGSGKTTLINYLLKKVPSEIKVGLINNTNIQPSQFFKLICSEYEVDVDFDYEKTNLMERFQEFLIRQYSQKQRVALIIDEAQNLAPKTMEEIRMLSNLESEKDHLIQIILVGQPELRHKLKRNDMVQFAQRVTVHAHISGLSQKETDEYIKHRLKVGEAKNLNLFSPKAVNQIHHHSNGIPRLVNILCDTALVYGFADGLKTIDEKVIDSVVKEREESGIFTGVVNYDDLRPSDGESPKIPISQRHHYIDEKLSLYEQKFTLMENKIDHLRERIDFLTSDFHGKEKFLIEIMKIFKDDLAQREKVIGIIEEYEAKQNTTHAELAVIKRQEK